MNLIHGIYIEGKSLSRKMEGFLSTYFNILTASSFTLKWNSWMEEDNIG